MGEDIRWQLIIKPHQFRFSFYRFMTVGRYYRYFIHFAWLKFEIFDYKIRPKEVDNKPMFFHEF